MAANEALNALSMTDGSNTPANTDVVGSTIDDEFRSNKANIARSARWEQTATATQGDTLGVTMLHKTQPCDGSAGGSITLVLPAAASAGEGFVMEFLKTGSTNPVIVDGNGAETINGAADYTFSAAFSGAKFACDGTSWFTALSPPLPATGVSYDNTASSLTGTNAQTAIDDLKEIVDALPARVPYQIDTFNLAGLASVQWEGLPQDCDFEVCITHRPSTDTYFTVQGTTNTGASPTFVTSGYHFAGLQIATTGSTYADASGIAAVGCYWNIVTPADSAYNANCTYRFMVDPAAGYVTYASTGVYRRSTDNDLVSCWTQGATPIVSVGALRVIINTGTFTSGSATLYAIPREA